MTTLEPGAVLGAYRLVRELGAGGMGAVWLAEHTMIGRRAAIKVLHESFAHRADVVARFFNEARAATAIADPGIVQIFDFGDHQGTAYIVMELLEGESLEQRLRREGALRIDHAARLVRQIASSLGAAHAAGIVHRDLKPDNIFLVPDLEVAGGIRAKILDFGIAKLASNTTGLKTQTSAVMGTPVYMSPEQCRGAGGVDQRSDIYSLGCLLFQAIAGRPPFEGEGPGDLLVAHLMTEPPAISSLVSGVSPELEQLVARCLAKDPAKRPTARELASLLATVVPGTSPDLQLSARVVSLTHTTLSSANGAVVGSRSAQWGVAIVALSVIAVIALVLVRSGDEPQTTPAAAPPPPVTPDASVPDSAIEVDAAPPPPPPPPEDAPAKPVAKRPVIKPVAKPLPVKPPEPRCKPPLVERNGDCIFETR